MTLTTMKPLCIFGITICSITQGSIANDYEIPWFDSSSVGTASLNNGDYAINGTIGQLAAGPTGETMGFTIMGGFWPGIGSNSSCLGDYNEDGNLDFFDISAFLEGFSAGDSSSDYTGDGIFNFFDISAFIAAFTDGCP
ncbi:MAG: GC-type dockerin domain-anchored protein [Phycisphaerales bacterium]